ncbi:MAG: hypothetical protein Q9227_003815 [Pyrenula ochraceoflavens]
MKNSQFLPPHIDAPLSVPLVRQDPLIPQLRTSHESITPPSSGHAPARVEDRSSRSSSIHDLLNPDPSLGDFASEASAMSRGVGLSSSSSDKGSAGQTDEKGAVAEQNQRQISSPQASKKRPLEEMDHVVAAEKTKPTGLVASPSDRPPKVRLSRSLDGSVKVKTTDEETPSPPKERFFVVDSANGPLQRSKSASALKNMTEGVPGTRSRPPKGSFGRSRDSRTWEFYCDSDVRESLSLHAELERKGSAAGAISLIRSSSKRNSDSSRQPLTPKAGATNVKRHDKEKSSKPKMVRAISSMARIQGNKTAANKPKFHEKQSEKMLEAQCPSHGRSPSTDSDKENWAPGTRDSVHPLRRQQSTYSSSSRPVLRERGHASTQGHKHPQRARKSSNLGDKENDDRVIIDDEVAAFMSGQGDDKEDDLDCVQGLLSLSQGAWK